MEEVKGKPYIMNGKKNDTHLYHIIDARGYRVYGSNNFKAIQDSFLGYLGYLGIDESERQLALEEAMKNVKEL